MDANRPGFQPAGALDGRPQAAQGAEFGERQEFVGVGGEPEVDQFSRVVEAHAGRLQRAQRGEAAGEREGQLLRWRAAGGVDDAAVGADQALVEALRHENLGQLRQFRAFLRPVERRSPRGGGADRVEAEGNVELFRVVAARGDEIEQRRDMRGGHPPAGRG